MNSWKKFLQLTLILCLTIIINVSLFNYELFPNNSDNCIETEQTLNEFYEQYIELNNCISDIYLISDDFVKECIFDSIMITFWISENHCSECIDSVFSILCTLSPYEIKKIIVFSDFQNPRLFKLLREKHLNRYNYYNTSFENIDLLNSSPIFIKYDTILNRAICFRPATNRRLLSNFILTRLIHNSSD